MSDAQELAFRLHRYYAATSVSEGRFWLSRLLATPTRRGRRAATTEWTGSRPSRSATSATGRATARRRSRRCSPRSALLRGVEDSYAGARSDLPWRNRGRPRSRRGGASSSNGRPSRSRRASARTTCGSARRSVSGPLLAERGDPTRGGLRDGRDRALPRDRLARTAHDHAADGRDDRLAGGRLRRGARVRRRGPSRARGGPADLPRRAVHGDGGNRAGRGRRRRMPCGSRQSADRSAPSWASSANSHSPAAFSPVPSSRRATRTQRSRQPHPLSRPRHHQSRLPARPVPGNRGDHRARDSGFRMPSSASRLRQRPLVRAAGSRPAPAGLRERSPNCAPGRRRGAARPREPRPVTRPRCSRDECAPSGRTTRPPGS